MSAGPLRWSFREYTVAQHASPFGHRFEAVGPEKQLVAHGRVKRGEDEVIFHANAKEGEELFRLVPKKVRLFSRAYALMDPRVGRAFAEIRRRDFRDVKKSEWVLYNGDQEEVGMVVETAPKPSLLRRLVPVDALFRKSWQVHWGQQVCGTIRPEASLLGDRMVLDLGLDTKDAVDRRVALGVAVLITRELAVRGPRAKV